MSRGYLLIGLVAAALIGWGSFSLGYSNAIRKAPELIRLAEIEAEESRYWADMWEREAAESDDPFVRECEAFVDAIEPLIIDRLTPYYDDEYLEYDPR
ncbi:MAG: hypothetical protein AAGI03_01830 [Pseudomonadota bacterium]